MASTISKAIPWDPERGWPSKQDRGVGLHRGGVMDAVKAAISNQVYLILMCSYVVCSSVGNTSRISLR